MQLIEGRPVYSARDLVGFLACRHLTDLDRLAMAHRLEKPIRDDPELDAIAERGKEHERRYLEELVAAHRDVTDLEVPEDRRPADRLTYYREAAARTRAAIEGRADVIFQACFFDETWLGFADFLLRIDDPVAPLGWSYEVADTKLAHSVKASAVLQICVYDELLAAVQGRDPERMHVALGGRERETRTFRTAAFAAYYRRAKAQFEAAVVRPLATGYDSLETYPEPTEHCDVCTWDPVCSARRRRDDHLSLVAGIRTRTRADLTERGTTTRRALAVLPLPVAPRLPHTSGETLERVREQARIQVQGDAVAPRLLHEVLEPVRGPDGIPDTTKGLLRLPEPSHGIFFLDLEGDPFAAEDGIDYLFGILAPARPGPDGQPGFTAHWSQESDGRITLAAEKRAFERTIDDIMLAWDVDPDMHVYHYAHYERTHLGSLSGRHATRQEEVDRLFRGGRLVDLYQVVLQGLRASVESYSIKRLEPLYGFERSVGLRDAGSSIAEFERWLRMGGESDGDRAALDIIERYNRDDVLSTWHLRDWLEGQRSSLAARSGEELPRPPVDEDKPKENLADWLVRVNQVAERLRAGLPEEATERIHPDQQGRWLLADLLGWHRREEKPDWWRFFNQLRDMTDEERLDAKEPLAMLRLLGQEASDETGRTFRYGFPEQDYELGRSPVNTATGNEMAVVAIDEERDEVVLRFKNGHDIVHPTSLVSHEYVPSRAQEQRLLDIGEWVADHGIKADGPYRAARDLLMRQPPRIIGHDLGAPLRHSDEEEPEKAARRLVPLLDRTTLAIQGPPGSGKTHTGARMILDLVGQGKTVGVTANSHKVIGKLLEDVWLAVEHDAEFAGRSVRLGQKPQEDSRPTCPSAEPMSTERAVAMLRSGEVDVVGATAWHWASEKATGSVDVLFIDEAGQFSLANAIAVSPAADSLVLLGDPQQLDQPLKGTHPAGAGRSALAHLLEGAAVMPDERGLFMRDTWRLHPTICEYTSEVFYEGRLQAHPGNEIQALAGVEPIDGVGIRFVGVDHEHAGDDSRSDAEAEVIADLVCDLLDAGAAWTDRDWKRWPIGPSDILVLTPYNAQRKRIGAALAARGERCATVSVGTVDKFQGQQAPISIYSMASSTPEDAPRGMEFLYSLNRLNVATSRARCVTLVVASPALVEVRAHSPRQMELANALCRLVEMAR